MDWRLLVMVVGSEMLGLDEACAEAIIAEGSACSGHSLHHPSPRGEGACNSCTEGRLSRSHPPLHSSKYPLLRYHKQLLCCSPAGGLVEVNSGGQVLFCFFSPPHATLGRRSRTPESGPSSAQRPATQCVSVLPFPARISHMLH